MNQPANRIDAGPATGFASQGCGAGPLVPSSRSPSHSGTQSPGRQGAGANGNVPLGHQAAGAHGQQAPSLERRHRVPKPRKSRRIRQPRLSREEKAAMRRLEERTPMDWYREIKKIRTPSVRCQIVQLVWWSYLAENFYGFKSRTILDAWRREWTFDIHVRPEVVERALSRLGWPPAVAKARAWIWEE